MAEKRQKLVCYKPFTIDDSRFTTQFFSYRCTLPGLGRAFCGIEYGIVSFPTLDQQKNFFLQING